MIMNNDEKNGRMEKSMKKFQKCLLGEVCIFVGGIIQLLIFLISNIVGEEPTYSDMIVMSIMISCVAGMLLYFIWFIYTDKKIKADYSSKHYKSWWIFVLIDIMCYFTVYLVAILMSELEYKIESVSDILSTLRYYFEEGREPIYIYLPLPIYVIAQILAYNRFKPH